MLCFCHAKTIAFFASESLVNLLLWHSYFMCTTHAVFISYIQNGLLKYGKIEMKISLQLLTQYSVIYDKLSFLSVLCSFICGAKVHIFLITYPVITAKFCVLAVALSICRCGRRPCYKCFTLWGPPGEVSPPWHLTTSSTTTVSGLYNSCSYGLWNNRVYEIHLILFSSSSFHFNVTRRNYRINM